MRTHIYSLTHTHTHTHTKKETHIHTDAHTEQHAWSRAVQCDCGAAEPAALLCFTGPTEEVLLAETDPQITGPQMVERNPRDSGRIQHVQTLLNQRETKKLQVLIYFLSYS